MARFIHELVQLQEKCRTSEPFNANGQDGDNYVDLEGEKRTGERTERLNTMIRDQLTVSNLWRESVIMDEEVSCVISISSVLQQPTYRPRCNDPGWRWLVMASTTPQPPNPAKVIISLSALSHGQSVPKTLLGRCLPGHNVVLLIRILRFPTCYSPFAFNTNPFLHHVVSFCLTLEVHF
jgi:hypothetical protein